MKEVCIKLVTWRKKKCVLWCTFRKTSNF